MELGRLAFDGADSPHRLYPHPLSRPFPPGVDLTCPSWALSFRTPVRNLGTQGLRLPAAFVQNQRSSHMAHT